MPRSPIDVATSPDGSIVVRPHGVVGQEAAVELRQLLVHTMRKVRPLRLVVDLEGVSVLDAINVGTLAAACIMGDECQVAVFMDNATPLIYAQLEAAGVPPQRLRSCVDRPAASGPARAPNSPARPPSRASPGPEPDVGSR